MIPITLTLESDRGPKRTFHFGVVNDQLFGPLMTYASILNTLGSYERQFGAATFSVRGTVTLKKHDAITFDNLFSGDQASMGAAAYIVAPITYLMGNDYEKVDLEGVDVTITSTEEPKTATLERVWLDDPRPRAGRTVPLKVLLRTYRGEEVVRTLPIEIPANASGTAVGAGVRRRPPRPGRTARGADSAAAAQRAADDSHAEQGAPEQHAVREAARLGRRRRRQRRAAVVAAAVGAGRARGRSQRRQLQPAAQRDARRVGTRDRARRERHRGRSRSPSRPTDRRRLPPVHRYG